MPNQEVNDCQPFSELCTRADLILSSSSKPQGMETSLSFQRDVAGVFNEYFLDFFGFLVVDVHFCVHTTLVAPYLF